MTPFEVMATEEWNLDVFDETMRSKRSNYITVIDATMRMLNDLTDDRAGLASNIKKKFKILNPDLKKIRDVAAEAELNHPQNPDVESWLRELIVVVRDLNDLMSYLYPFATAQEKITGKTKKKRSHLPKGNCLQLIRSIKKIKEELRNVANDSKQFDLGGKTKSTATDLGVSVKEVIERDFRGKPAITAIDSEKDVIGREVKKDDQLLHHRGASVSAGAYEEEVIGREEEKKEIIDQLLLQRGALIGSVLTITISGIKGIGKTKLSKLIYNDERVREKFEQMIWLTVDDGFDANQVVESIVQSTGKTKLKAEPEIQTPQEALGKRSYLLVLDDLRNLDRHQWDSLQRMLTEAGASTGVILVTTRSNIVAKIASSTTPYALKELSEDDSWSLFERIALFDEQGQRLNDSRISDIGTKLISKCRGIPLAITIMSTLLRTRVPEVPETELAQFERKVLEDLKSEYYDELRSVYYDDLPLHAKDCFAYCSLFPKNYSIDVLELIDLWLGEGFLVTTNLFTSLRPEDVGHNILYEFFQRSIFQDVKHDEWGMVKTCKMHHLMHDLATSIGSEENASMDQKGCRVRERVLRVSFDFISEISLGIPESLLLKAKRLRTILLPTLTPSRLPHKVKLTRFECHKLIFCFKNLRVLDLHNLGIKALPSSIGQLKNLKSLDLSQNKMEKLPNSITKLVHLQTLKLSHCHRLKKLPKNLQSLLYLRHLRIDGCLDLTHMPRGIRKLTSLQTLSYFVASKNYNSSFCSHIGGLSELSKLNNLKGDLEILHLERLKYDVPQAKNQTHYLKEKPHLRRLTLRWDHDKDCGRRHQDEENAIRCLEPDPNLKALFILGYNGLEFPRWLSSLESLVKFSLYNCSKCQFLPPLHQLPSLKIVELRRLDSLEFIAGDDNGLIRELESSTSAIMPGPFFPSLSELTISSCPNLKTWWKTDRVAEASFPCISRLQIRYCPNLISIPIFPQLDEKLELVCCSMEPLRKTINAVSSPFSHPLSKLKSVLIEKVMTSSIEVEWLRNFNSLEDLHIRDCSNLTHLLKGFDDLCSLKYLTVENSPELDMPSEEWNGLTNLHTLTLRRIPKLLSLPRGLEYVTSVQNLELHSCSGLKSLSDKIGKLTSLKRLEISECYDLASLPKEMENLKSLEKLVIRDCPKLLPRCQPETGDDWPCIKHIGPANITVTKTSGESNLMGYLGK